MTNRYPEGGIPTASESRYQTAEVTSYVDADDDDLVACMVGSIGGARYDKNGVFMLTIEVPFDVIGDPTELMRSQGMMLLWEVRKMG